MKLRKLATAVLLVAASFTTAFTTAFTAGTIAAQPASASVAASSSRDQAACSAAYHFHHVSSVPALYADEALWQSAYAAAMDSARKAGPEVSGVVVHWLREGDQWSWVRAACAGYRR